MRLKAWLLSRGGIVVVATVLTLIVLAESIFPPWAPYFLIYAILAIVIPLSLKTYSFGSIRAVLLSGWRITLGVFALAFIWDLGISGWLHEQVLVGLGVSADPFYSLSAAISQLGDVAAHKFGITSESALMLYALFVVLWAPIGEELFYRGYMQGTLRQHHSFGVAALVSAAFFGIRHATHLFFLWPAVPLVAAGTWVVSTFVFGILMSYLYEKTHSLYPPILVHFLVNVVEILMSL